MGELVDICAILFGGYASLLPLEIIVLYGKCKPELWKFITFRVIFYIVTMV